MAETINDLYLKYANKVGQTLERDRYFQYLFEMVKAGTNLLAQRKQVLHKVVDERWLSTIEESLDALNNVIDKPRRFITTTEEVVPVSLAKKITAESVRHLSQNTQFIASDEGGDVQPTRILNVTVEESYDLYENRFIYHLIQRLVTFIDKRTDLIFWSTGDEKRDVISFESRVDDAYEQIEYKMEMKITNLQSFAENDSDNMDVFMRIDRVRRLVMALRNSPFCALMKGCSVVRSPIQRTNLMMKDPQYRACYRLWQFLESYDEVGYSIEVRDSVMEFDEDYIFQLYTNLITNYAVFKSIAEEEPRQLDEALLAKRRKVHKPKFIKQIQEEIVTDYDIPEVEIRKVIIEEVTQAQLDAEAKAAKEAARADEAEQARVDAERQAQSAYQRMNDAMSAMQEAQRAADAAIKAKDDAEQSMAQAAHQARDSIAEANKARIEAERNASVEADARLAAEEARDKALADREAALAQAAAAKEVKAAAEEDRRKANERRREAEHERSELKKALAAAERKLASLQKSLDTLTAARDADTQAKHLAETESAAAKKSAAAAEKARDAALTRAQSAEEARSAALLAKKEADSARVKAVRSAEAAEKAKEAALLQLKEAKETRAAADKAIRAADSARSAAEKKSAAALQHSEEVRAQRDEAIAEAKAARAAQSAAEKAARQSDAAREAAESRIAGAEARAQAAHEERQNALSRMKEAREARDKSEQARKDAIAARKAAEAHASESDAAAKEAAKRAEAAHAALSDAEAALAKERELRIAAEERADANSISKRILTAWDQRRRK